MTSSLRRGRGQCFLVKSFVIARPWPGQVYKTPNVSPVNDWNTAILDHSNASFVFLPHYWQTVTSQKALCQGEFLETDPHRKMVDVPDCGYSTRSIIALSCSLFERNWLTLCCLGRLFCESPLTCVVARFRVAYFFFMVNIPEERKKKHFRLTRCGHA